MLDRRPAQPLVLALPLSALLRPRAWRGCTDLEIFLLELSLHETAQDPVASARS